MTRNSDWPQILHRLPQNPGFDMRNYGEGDLADLYLRSLFDDERDAHRRWRDGSHLGTNGGELSAVFGEQFLDDNLGSLHLGRVVLALDRERDLAFLKAVENVAFRD